ncbi:uncharacterized protein [Oscarella lobularis]|uniref:uncharacterized protein n=1 Tax=Oscarella lobularis TaxID=121494 RepID=UPI00331423A6
MAGFALPFKHDIVLGPMTSVEIKGKAGPSPYRFNVNLMLDEAEQNNALHFNPRFDQRQVVLNSKTNGKYGGEEKPPAEFLFEPNKKFKIRIFVTSEDFQLAVNGRCLYFYKHRLPYQSIRRLVINDQPKAGPSVFINDISIKEEGGPSLISNGRVVQLIPKSYPYSTLRMRPDGSVDAFGGRGKKAQFQIVARGGNFLFKNVKNPSLFLAIKDGHLKSGGGGPFCEFKPSGAGAYVVFQSAKFPGQHIGVLPNGDIKPAANTGRGEHGQFLIRIMD